MQKKIWEKKIKKIWEKFKKIWENLWSTRECKKLKKKKYFLVTKKSADELLKEVSCDEMIIMSLFKSGFMADYIWRLSAV